MKSLLNEVPSVETFFVFFSPLTVSLCAGFVCHGTQKLVHRTHLSNFTMDEDTDTGSLPDLKDIESKVGRKVPDSLIRSLAGGKRPDEHDKSAHLTGPKRHNSSPSNSADLKRLESKMLFLKQEMVSTSVLANLKQKPPPRVKVAFWC